MLLKDIVVGQAEAHYNMGQTFDDMGRIESAIACYTTSVQLQPDWWHSSCPINT